MTIDEKKNFIFNIFQIDINKEENESIKNILLNDYKDDNFLNVNNEIKFDGSIIEDYNVKICEI